MSPLHLVLLVLTPLSVLGSLTCNLPSHLWCSSRHTARLCQVERHCEERDWREERGAPPVSLTLYYETMCPFCKEFITEQLYPTFSKLGPDVLNVTALPFGNAHTCAIKNLNYNSTAYLPFLKCMEQSSTKGVDWDSVLDKCGPKFNVSTAYVKVCAGGNQGNWAEHLMGEATQKEGVQYVPWIVVNGQHTKQIQSEAQDHLLKLVCKTYTGPRPSACSSVLDQPLSHVTFPSAG